MLVDVSNIIVAKDRGRKEFKNLSELMESITKYGLLHPPVVIPADEKGKYKLVAGERRYRSCCLLGLKQIPVTLRKDLSELQEKEIELEENIARENLSWPEQIELYRQIDALKRKLYGDKMQGDSKGDGWNIQKTADMLNMDRSHLTKQINFAKLLKEKPDLKEKLNGLPLTIAMRKAKMILEAENLERINKDKTVSLEIKLGNCIELLKELEDGSVDLLLTDIPYGVEAINIKSNNYKGLVKDQENSCYSEVYQLIQAIKDDAVRVLKPSAHFYIFHSIDQYSYIQSILIGAGLLPDPVPLIWDKTRTTAPFRGYFYASCYEMCTFGHKPPRTKMLSQPCKSIIQMKTPSVSEKIHVFQKPVELLEYFIKQSTNMGDLVLDPFAGSGSTILAAKKCGRRGLGFEVNKENYLRARKAIEGADEHLQAQIEALS
jgi:site-specific DNA-methyltransferase (adenine-specific)